MTVHEQFSEDLALYALGALDDAERARLERHLEGCAQCRREYQQLQGDLGLLGLALEGPSPPASSRTRLMQAVASEPRVRVRSKPARTWLVWVFAATTAIMAVISIGLWRKNEALRQDVAALTAQSSQSKLTAARAKELLDVLTDPDAVRITLIASNAKPQPQGKAIYLKRSGGLVFVASNLPPVQPHMAYELWLLPASGAPPVAAGVFNPDSRGNANVLMPELAKNVEAKAFAVTVEPETGSNTPTMPIVLAGGQ